MPDALHRACDHHWRPQRPRREFRRPDQGRPLRTEGHWWTGPHRRLQPRAALWPPAIRRASAARSNTRQRSRSCTRGPVTVTADVTLDNQPERGFFLAVHLKTRVEGVDHATAERLVHKAHKRDLPLFEGDARQRRRSRWRWFERSSGRPARPGYRGVGRVRRHHHPPLRARRISRGRSSAGAPTGWPHSPPNWARPCCR